jgi:acetyltransferase-like isoleucine patch superfamily enzyme
MDRIALRGRLMEPWRRRQFHRFGAGSLVHRPNAILGAHHIAIGANTLVLHNAWLAVETPAHDQPAPVLRIGDRVGIRPFCTISASESVVIEDDVVIASYTSIVDSDHSFAQGRPNVMHNGVVSEPIHIGRGTWIAERVAVLRGARIGRCCIVGANSVVRGELPDFSIAVGAPARVVGQVEGVDPDALPAVESLY